jgi:hypothetical protein
MEEDLTGRDARISLLQKACSSEEDVISYTCNRLHTDEVILE